MCTYILFLFLSTTFSPFFTKLEVPFICIEHIVNLALEGLVLWRKVVAISLNIVIFNLCKRDLKDSLIYNMQI